MNLLSLWARSRSPRPKEWKRHHAQACAKCRAMMAWDDSVGSRQSMRGYMIMRSNIKSEALQMHNHQSKQNKKVNAGPTAKEISYLSKSTLCSNTVSRLKYLFNKSCWLILC